MMNKKYQNITLENLDSGIKVLTVNRPKQMNALNTETITELAAAVQLVADDVNASVLLITGAGEKAFIAGADISEFQGVGSLEARALSQVGQVILSKLENLDIPVIAVVNGFALGGGCELALACDWIIASDNAKFGQPEINLGIMPGFGGSQRLMRLVGKSLAMELCMTGRMIDAKEAQEIGLANQIYQADDLMDEAMKLAKTLSQKAPIALKFIKQVMHDGQNMALENACQFESELFALCFSTEDQEEGVAAFLEKRKAVFKGR
jgi:enoyl-CoA hydratase